MTVLGSNKSTRRALQHTVIVADGDSLFFVVAIGVGGVVVVFAVVVVRNIVFVARARGGRGGISKRCSLIVVGRS